MTKTKELIELGASLWRKGNKIEGAEAYRRSMRANPAESEKTLALAARLFEEGDYEHARTFLETYLEYHKNDGAYILMGRALAALGRASEAAMRYEDAFQINKNVPALAYRECAKLYHELGNNDSAYARYRIAFKMEPQRLDAIDFLADYAFKRALYREAFEYFSAIMKANRADYTHYFHAGVCLHEEGNYREAEKMYERAFEAFPGAAEYKAYLKSLRKKTLADYYTNSEALEAECAAKAKRGTANQNDYFELGNIAFVRGDYQRARAYYEQAKAFLTKAS